MPPIENDGTAQETPVTQDGQNVHAEDAFAPEVNVLFRHKEIRRYRVGGFEFKNYELRIRDAAKLAEFRHILEGQPRIETIHIVEINEEAAALAERPAVGSGVVRGSMSSDDILTAKDRERLANLGKTQEGAAQKPAGGGFAGFLNKK